MAIVSSSVYLTILLIRKFLTWKCFNGSIDGFIMSLSKETQFKGDFHHISEVIDQGMPVVMFDRVTNEILCDKVIIDDKMAA
jgi:LacI family transcriptional regulator